MTKIKRHFRPAALFLLFAVLSQVAFGQEEYFKIDSTETKTGVRRAAEEKKTGISEEGEKKFIDKLRLGGSAGLRFGTFTNVNLSPMVGLELFDNFVAGLGATYIFVKDSYFIPNSLSNFYGTRLMARYNPAPVFHIQAEYELMNVEFQNHGYQQTRDDTFLRTWLHSPMLGIGYSQPVGGRFIKGIHATLLYNFNYQNHINPSINYDPRFFNPAMSQRNISHYASPIVFRVSIL